MSLQPNNKESTASGPLTAGSDKLKLSLDASPRTSGFFLAGDTVHGRAIVSNTASFTAIDVELICRSNCAIRGKARWQVGQMAAGGLGSPQSLIMEMEENILHQSKQILWPQPDGKTQSAHSGHVELSFSMRLPEYQKKCTCVDHEHPLRLPSSSQCPLDQNMDMSRISTTWTVNVIGERSGILHRDKKIHLDIPVASPVVPSIRGFAELDPPVTYSTAPLLFKGPGGGMAIQARLDIPDLQDDVLYAKGGCDLPVIVTWWLVSGSGGEPPSDALLDSIQPKVDVSLSRYPFTRPIVRPHSGDPFAWANQRTSTGRVQPASMGKNGERQVHGTVPIPSIVATVKSCSLSVNFAVHANLSSKSLSKHLMLSKYVVITHAS